MNYTYDALKQFTGDTNQLGLSESFSYDPAGLHTSLTWVGENRKIAYRYNPDGELTSLADSQGRQTSFRYDAAGYAVSRTLPNWVETSYRYDPAGWLTGVSYPFTNGIVVSDLATRASLGLLGAGGQSGGRFGAGLPGAGGSADHAGGGPCFLPPQLPDHGASGYDALGRRESRTVSVLAGNAGNQFSGFTRGTQTTQYLYAAQSFRVFATLASSGVSAEGSRSFFGGGASLTPAAEYLTVNGSIVERRALGRSYGGGAVG